MRSLPGVLKKSPLLFLMLLLAPCQLWSTPIRVLIDVRSTHSDGAHDMDTLVSMARNRDIDVLAFSEHDRFSIRFGIAPVSRILGYSMQHPSLYTTGLESFFADLARVRGKYTDISFMAATESTPGYSWTGIPFHNLALHNAERHIIALGTERPDQIKALSSYNLRNIHGPFKVSIAFWLILVGGILLVLLRRRKRTAALLLLASFIAFLAAWQFKPKVDADADFIQTARQQGLFVIWAHPGTLSGVRPGPMGIKLDTPPYSKRVFHTPTADGFAALYGDTDTNTMPGGLWDRYMIDYMRGYHDKPIWATAAGDFHENGRSGEYLGNFPMDIWTEAHTMAPAAILAAMRRGHMVAWHMPKDRNLRINTLFLEDATGNHWLPGDEVTVPGQVILHCSLTENPASAHPMAAQLLRVQIIVDGRVVALALMGMNQPLQESIQLPPGAHVVRLRVPGQNSIRMEANPFLVRVQG